MMQDKVKSQQTKPELNRPKNFFERKRFLNYGAPAQTEDDEEVAENE